MKKQEVIRLLERYRAGNCSAKERYLVERWFDQLHTDDPLPLSEDEMFAIETDIWDKLQEDQRKPQWKLPMYVRALAAMLLLGLLFGVHRYTSQHTPHILSQLDSPEVYDKLAAADRAVLTLSSGKHVVLDSLPMGMITEDDAIRVTKDQEGCLVFEAIEPNKAGKSFGFQEIQTPRGGHYKITLTDGSTVWLGPASKLKYPTSFATDERRVTVEGEAYFEVAKKLSGSSRAQKPDYVPFFVETPRQTVQVLGTHFNVNDYREDPLSRVTLLEGRVRVHSGSSKAKLLSPGQQSAVKAKDQELTVVPVDIQEYLARKDGNFYFNDTELQEVMRQLELWYDIDVVDKEKLPTNRYTGKLPRNVNLSKILQVMEITSGLKFKIENERRLHLVN